MSSVSAEVVALHGFTQSGAMWREVAAAVGGRWHLPDLHAGTIGAAERRVAAAMAIPSGPFILVGYSMGGRLALGEALRHPPGLVGLVLISTGPGIADPIDRESRRLADGALADRAMAMGGEAFLDEWLAAPMFSGLADRGEAWRAADRRTRCHDTAALAAVLRGWGQGAWEPLRDRLDEVAAPSLLIAGGDDGSYVAHVAEMANGLSDAEVVVVDGVGHAVVGEAPAAAGRAIVSWRRRVVGPEHTFD